MTLQKDAMKIEHCRMMRCGLNLVVAAIIKAVNENGEPIIFATQRGKLQRLFRMTESRLQPRGIRYLLPNMRLQPAVESAYGSGIRCNPARS